ncbi:MAG TPA: HIT family protein [Caulobacteraceae bacterium]|nr:HIT family protein [Caulobacteraceae bacterium]
MSLDGDYDPDNLFARIVRGEAPAAKVFEDHDVLAFMDVFPQGRGHTLVVHKRAPARNLLDIEPEPLQTLIMGVQRVARAVRAALKPDAILVTQFNGEAAGQTIYHLHFHVIPRWAGAPLGRHAGGARADPAELDRLAKAIGDEIA